MENAKVVEKHKAGKNIELTGYITVDRTPETCYRYWRDFKNLPQFLKHISTVVETDSRHSHWTVTGPADTTVEWDAELVKDIPGKLISWRSTENAQVDNSGIVEFKRTGKGSTEIKAVITYAPPLGILGEWITKMFGGSPNDILEHNLGLFKQAVESGQTKPH